MARRNDNGEILLSIIGFIVVIIMIIGEAFRGNFTPLLVVMGIILLIYVFINVTELRRHIAEKNKINTDVNPESNSDFSRFIWILLLLGLFVGGCYLNQSSPSNFGNAPAVEPMQTPVIIDSASTVAEVPKEIIWSVNDFMNCIFQIPGNLSLDNSLSTDKTKLYIDYDLNISMTIVADYLSDEMKGKTIDDFADNISILANSINEENKRNFDDFKLLSYEMSSLGNSKAIKIEESYKKVSGPKNIEMRIISYHIIANPYYYKVTFSYPEQSSELSKTFDQINKTFDFINSSKIENKNELGYYTVSSNLMDRVYFYDSPEESFRRKSYLIPNEIVYVQKINNGFGYVDFINNRGVSTKGWIKMSALIKKEN